MDSMYSYWKMEKGVKLKAGDVIFFGAVECSL
jgi:hypothetical protein